MLYLLLDMPAKLVDGFHQPTATVHVVLPGYIGFTVLPGRKWILETAREYEISVDLYDKERHPILVSEVGSCNYYIIIIIMLTERSVIL